MLFILWEKYACYVRIFLSSAYEINEMLNYMDVIYVFYQ